MNFFDYLFNHSKSLDKEFVLGASENITFRELYNNCIRLSQIIVNEFGNGQNIIQISPNSVFSITTYLSIIKSGNSCVPVDHAIEISNWQYIVDLVEPKLVFCHSKIRSNYTFPAGCTVVDENELSKMLDSSEPLKSPEFDFFDPAEIVFTSGSTGRPKGVMLSHENLRSNTESILSYLKLSERDRVCNVLPFHYCYGLSLLHTHLRVGGSMVLNNSFIFLGSVINDIKNYQCTGFSGVPSHFQILLKKSAFFNEDLPHLRYFTQAGGKLHNNFIEEINKAVPDKKFFVMYGQTEATARLSYLSPELVMEKLGSIGKPIYGVEFKVVNEDGVEVEKGAEGELIARGKNIMMGYYKDAEETFTTVKGGWLFTGDMVIEDREGYYYIVGRKKEFIKVRGKRVSPKEIEEIILKLPEVVHCRILSYADELTGEGILAQVSVSRDTDPVELEKRIIGECNQHLVEYKIPTKFEILREMNLKTSGKI